MKNSLKLNKILIAVDDSQYSDTAAEYGFTLASKLNAEVALLHVNEIPISTPYMTDPMVSEPNIILPEMMEIQEAASKRLLDRISKLGKGVKIETFEKLGSPKDEILATAEEWHADMIILGTHGRTGLDHFLTGSIAEGVVRRATCPVLIIPRS